MEEIFCQGTRKSPLVRHARQPLREPADQLIFVCAAAAVVLAAQPEHERGPGDKVVVHLLVNTECRPRPASDGLSNGIVGAHRLGPTVIVGRVLEQVPGEDEATKSHLSPRCWCST